MFVLGSKKNIIISVFTVKNKHILLKYYSSSDLACVPMIKYFFLFSLSGLISLQKGIKISHYPSLPIHSCDEELRSYFHSCDEEFRSYFHSCDEEFGSDVTPVTGQKWL